jgi:hypothetical protein
VTSRTTRGFRECLAALPREVRDLAFKAFRLWKSDPFHPSLHFKQVDARKGIWSARVSIGWRALGVEKEGAMVWFWIGSHADYDRKVG